MTEFADEWWDSARCKGVSREAFFPHRDEVTDVARIICGSCPVAQECLDFAVRTHQCGTWGGTCDTDRERIRRKRRPSSVAYFR